MQRSSIFSLNPPWPVNARVFLNSMPAEFLLLFKILLTNITTASCRLKTYLRQVIHHGQSFFLSKLGYHCEIMEMKASLFCKGFQCGVFKCWQGCLTSNIYSRSRLLKGNLSNAKPHQTDIIISTTSMLAHQHMGPTYAISDCNFTDNTSQ